MKKSILLVAILLVYFSICGFAYSKDAERYYYQIKIYHFKNKAQENRIDRFLKEAYLPALHRAGIIQVGVFKPIVQDTSDQLIYVFIPFQKFDQFQNLNKVLEKDKLYYAEGKDYLEALYNNIPYTRIESILLHAFSAMPKPAKPNLYGPKSERVYEYRSYESATESYATNKIKMFNESEVAMFKQLGFNAIFYGQVISGSRMPNLIYMTTFNNKADRDKHWQAFGPEYKKISGLPEYQNNVSKNNTSLLFPTDYSDY